VAPGFTLFQTATGPVLDRSQTARGRYQLLREGETDNPMGDGHHLGHAGVDRIEVTLTQAAASRATAA
jgi:hypothetical protein